MLTDFTWCLYKLIWLPPMGSVHFFFTQVLGEQMSFFFFFSVNPRSLSKARNQNFSQSLNHRFYHCSLKSNNDIPCPMTLECYINFHEQLLGSFHVSCLPFSESADLQGGEWLGGLGIPLSLWIPLSLAPTPHSPSASPVTQSWLEFLNCLNWYKGVTYHVPNQ